MKGIIERLTQAGIHPNENLGQHILVSNDALDLLARQVITGASVIEVGSGPGNLTDKLAGRASEVIGIEIDRQYGGLLDSLQDSRQNVEIIYGDALKVDFGSLIKKTLGQTWQIIANLPYHISEPFLRKATKAQVEDIVLTVGDSLGRSMQTNDPSSPDYTKISLLTQAFFRVDEVGILSKNAFYPPPRTDSTIVRLTPLSESEVADPVARVARHLFNTEKTTVGKAIREALITASQDTEPMASKHERNRMDRRRTRNELQQIVQSYGQTGEIVSPTSGRTRHKKVVQSVGDLGLPERILSSPFSALTNADVKILVTTLQDKLKK